MKYIVSLAAFAALGAAGANAGGYVAPVIEVTPTAPVQASPSSNWTGFYGGLQAGGLKIDGTNFNPGPAARPKPPYRPLSLSLLPVSGTSLDKSGYHYGVHAGYLHGFGNFVGGAELAYDKLDGLKVDDEKFDGDMFRGKLLVGYDAGKFLPYATVGYAHVKLDDFGSDNGFGYGVGVKYMATPNIMIGAEWMRHEFEWKDARSDTKGDFDIDTFGVNISYRF